MNNYELYAAARNLLDSGKFEEHVTGYYEALECLYEMRAENANECAMFGDSGPGSALRVREVASELAAEKLIIDAAYALA